MNHPEPNTIILCEGFYYVYLGVLNSPNALRLHNAQGADIIGVFGDGDGCLDRQYIYVRAVHPVDGKYHFIPSSFSDIGTLDVSRRWIVVQKNVRAIPTLSAKQCRKICPGYLD